jgi:hypothetical protein
LPKGRRRKAVEPVEDSGRYSITKDKPRMRRVLKVVADDQGLDHASLCRQYNCDEEK